MSKTTNSNAKYKKLTDSVFNRDIYFVVGSGPDADELIRNKFSVDESVGEDADGVSISSEDGTFIIWVEKHDGSPYWDGVLAHEILHTIFDVMHFVGVKHCGDSEEVYTHFMGSLMRQIKQFLKKV